MLTYPRGRSEFPGRFKGYFGSQILSQSLNEIHIPITKMTGNLVPAAGKLTPRAEITKKKGGITPKILMCLDHVCKTKKEKRKKKFSRVN